MPQVWILELERLNVGAPYECSGCNSYTNMPLHRSRSPSERKRSLSPYRHQGHNRDDELDRSKRRRRDRDYHKHDSDYDDDAAFDLPDGAEAISEDDYFLRNSEFRKWLREDKSKVSRGPVAPYAI